MPRTDLCRAAALPSPSAWPRPASQLPHHVSLVHVGTLFLSSPFSGETTQALAQRPGLPLGSLPVPSLAMPSET